MVEEEGSPLLDPDLNTTKQPKSFRGIVGKGVRFLLNRGRRSKVIPESSSHECVNLPTIPIDSGLAKLRDRLLSNSEIDPKGGGR